MNPTTLAESIKVLEMTHAIKISNIDEILEKLFNHIEQLVEKEKRGTAETRAARDEEELKRSAGKIQALQDKLAAIEAEEAARRENKDEYLPAPVKLKLEAATLRRRITGMQKHGGYYSEYC
jgi:chromosome segregation ATPase